jgi:hypothetical protein
VPRAGTGLRRVLARAGRPGRIRNPILSCDREAFNRA